MSNLDLEKVGTSSVAMFNIVLEAKVGAMVQMTKKMRPDLKTKEELIEFLHSAIDYGVEHYNE